MQRNLVSGLLLALVLVLAACAGPAPAAAPAADQPAADQPAAGAEEALTPQAVNAIRYMIEHLVAEHAMSAEQAYSLCGAAVDLKISEIVDAPNWIVSAYLPLAIFTRFRGDEGFVI
jgi:acetamidase/formamidase